jgi:hypothetical protein
MGHILHMGRGEKQIEFWSTCLQKRHDNENIGVGGRILLKYNKGKSIKMVWTGLVWLRTGARDGVLGSRQMLLGLDKIRKIS